MCVCGAFLLVVPQGLDPKRVKGHKLFQLYRNLQAAEMAMPARPSDTTTLLAVKLCALLDCATVALRRAWGGANAKECGTKMIKQASVLSGGVEA